MIMYKRYRYAVNNKNKIETKQDGQQLGMKLQVTAMNLEYCKYYVRATVYLILWHVSSRKQKLTED